jgi:prepilin-type N-terminal cleavage/methylation domain-containing protein
MRKYRFGADRGFTLIELLIVIAIIGFLAAAILVAVDPVKRVQQSRNAKRWAEANAILNAILTKQVDERAAYSGHASAPIIPDTTYSQVLVTDRTGVDCAVPATAPTCPGASLDPAATGFDCIVQVDDLANPVSGDSYLAEVPLDPLGDGTVPAGGGMAIGTDNTGYYIHKFPNGRIEVGACHPDLSESIKVKR